jgi:hypothetical protein
MNDTLYTTGALARRAGASVGLVNKLRELGILRPLRASNGICLYGDEHVEIVKARLAAWRDRPSRGARVPHKGRGRREEQEAAPSLRAHGSEEGDR